MDGHWERWSQQSNPELMEDSRVERKPPQQDTWATSSISAAPTARSSKSTLRHRTQDSVRTQESGDPETSASRAIVFFFFKNMVFNALLSGLEVCVFTKCEMDKLQAHAETLARRPLGRRGWGAVKGDDNKTSVPSRWVRAQLGIWIVESTLRYRRLRWFHSVVSQQFHHDMMWAVLFGKFEWESVEEIDEVGHPREKTLPYVKHLASDLQTAGCFQGFRTEWTAELNIGHNFPFWRADNSCFLSFSVPLEDCFKLFNLHF